MAVVVAPTGATGFRSNPIVIPAFAVDRDLRVEPIGAAGLIGAPDRTIARPIRVRLRSATGQTSVVDSLSCWSAGVQFTPLSGGSATPALAPTAWDGKDCSAEARWHLSAEVGRQALMVFAVQAGATPTPRSNPDTIVAEALAPPRDFAVTLRRRPHWTFVSQTTLWEAVVSARDSTHSLNEAQCDSVWVKLTPYASGTGVVGDAGVSPAQTTWRNGSCTATATWRLSDEPGRQYLEAVVVQGSAATAIVRSEVVRDSVKARKWMSLVFGLALTHSRVLYDSLIALDTVFDRAASRPHVTPVIGAEFPVPPPVLRWLWPWLADRFRMMFAVSAHDPTREWYLGVSLNTLLGGHFEGDAIRFAAGVREQHLTRMRSSPECVLPTGLGWATGHEYVCPESRHPLSGFVSVTIDGASLVTSLLGGFGLTPQ